jgi:hypothetical protein
MDGAWQKWLDRPPLSYRAMKNNSKIVAIAAVVALRCLDVRLL